MKRDGVCASTENLADISENQVLPNELKGQCIQISICLFEITLLPLRHE